MSSRSQPQSQFSHPHHKVAASCAFELFDSTRRLSATSINSLQTQVAQALVELANRPEGASLCSGSLRAKLIDDTEMATLHLRHSGIAGPTDILTFDLRQTPKSPLDTDLLIDLDEAARQAVARNHALESELLLYIIHGVLHCLGFDDHDDAQFSQMHALEDQVLAAIGIGPIFSRPGTESQGANP